MADKRNDADATDELPPIWGDNSNLRMTGDNCPPTDEEALYARVVADEPTLRQEAEELINFLNERYSDQE